MAKKAADETKNAAANEQAAMANLVGELENLIGGSGSSSGGTSQEQVPQTLKEAMEKHYKFLANKTYTVGEKSITIPAGFYVSDPEKDPTIVYANKEDPKIDEGIVITDAVDAEGKSIGNEFVWVPCTLDEYVKHTYDNENNDEGTNRPDTKGGWNTWYYRAYKDWKEDDEETNRTNVGNNKGFYIARYEAGVPSGADFYVSKDEVGSKSYPTDKGTQNGANVSSLKPVSQKGMQAWNLITQEKALTVAGNMYNSGNYGVTSKLVDGIAWDRTIAWISTNSKFSSVAMNSTNYGNYANNGEDIGDKNGSTKKIKYKGFEVSNTLWAEHLYKAEDSTIIDWCIGTKYRYGKFTSGYADPWEGSTDGYTNYDEDSKYHYRHYVEMATGASENTKMNNIYDMAGNMYEWTTEYGFHEQVGGTKYALLRGGGFMDKSAPVSFRKGDGLASMMASVDRGFRVVLYVK